MKNKPVTYILGLFALVFISLFTWGILHSNNTDDNKNTQNKQTTEQIQEERAKKLSQSDANNKHKSNKKSSDSKFIVKHAKLKYSSKDIDLAQIPSKTTVTDLITDMLTLRSTSDLSHLKSKYSMSKEFAKTTLPKADGTSNDTIYWNRTKVNVDVKSVAFDFTDFKTHNYNVFIRVKADTIVKTYVLTFDTGMLINLVKTSVED